MSNFNESMKPFKVHFRDEMSSDELKFFNFFTMRSETLAETFLTKKAVLHGASWHFYLFMRWGPWESRIDLSVKYNKI